MKYEIGQAAQMKNLQKLVADMIAVAVDDYKSLVEAGLIVKGESAGTSKVWFKSSKGWSDV